MNNEINIIINNNGVNVSGNNNAENAVLVVQDKQQDFEVHAYANGNFNDTRTRIIKHNNIFAVFNILGNIQPHAGGNEGVYVGDTRFLSRLEVAIAHTRPLLLSSNLRDDSSILSIDLMNSDIALAPDTVLLRGSVHLQRSLLLFHQALYEEMLLTNFSALEVHFPLAVYFESDFKDIFEVRGMNRSLKGELYPPQLQESSMLLGYRGRDGRERFTQIVLSDPPTRLLSAAGGGGVAIYELHLRPKEVRLLHFTCYFQHASESSYIKYNYRQACVAQRREFLLGQEQACKIETSHGFFNEWIKRSHLDLNMLITSTPYGLYPYAGVPWFSTTFGRDGIITALLTLWINPNIARGVLNFLAHTQSQGSLAASDAERGKILHEARDGEMAATGEVPFKLYYGSIDATPLFIILAEAYYRATADLEFIRHLWPHIKMALAWIDGEGDVDGDGLVEYQRKSATGLINQGWKDSVEAIFHADGTLCEGPIALCEVQGYVYDAKKRASLLASELDEHEYSWHLYREASDLKALFHEKFWCPEISSYAMALDGQKRPCKVLSSNAGHCLFTGIVSENHAADVVQGLFGQKMYSGWGIRTIAEGEALYNPMSYHNGSVWPHDNALIALGLSRYNFKLQACQLLADFADAANFVDHHRLPELFCGFSRRGHEGPTLYPVACIPQAWSTVTVFALLQACLGLHIDAPREEIYFYHPELPEFLKMVEIKNLRIKNAILDVAVYRHLHDVGLNIVNRTNQAKVIIVK